MQFNCRLWGRFGNVKFISFFVKIRGLCRSSSSSLLLSLGLDLQDLVIEPSICAGERKPIVISRYLSALLLAGFLLLLDLALNSFAASVC